MANIKVSDMTALTSLPDDALLYVVLPDGSYGKVTKAEFLSGITGGTTPTLQQVLNQGSTATFVGLGGDILQIDEVVNTAFDFYHQKSMSSANGENQASESLNPYQSTRQGIFNNATYQATNQDIVAPINGTSGFMNLVRSLYKEIFLSGHIGSWNLFFPTPKTGATPVNVNIEMPYKELEGTYRIATIDDISSELSLEITKCSFITITQAVNLDNIETRVNELDAAVVLKGTWSAASGSFPSGAQAGWSYLVTTNGTIDGVEFAIGDRLICVLDNASTTTYAGNWYKADYTDRVNTVSGRTGNVVITSSDLSDFNSAVNALITLALASFKTTNFLDFTSSGQTQLNLRSIVLKNNFTPNTLTAPVSTEAIVDNYDLGVGFLAVGESLNFEAVITKNTSVNGTIQSFVYLSKVSNSISVTDAVKIATSSALGSGGGSVIFVRTFHRLTSSILSCRIAGTTATSTDIASLNNIAVNVISDVNLSDYRFLIIASTYSGTSNPNSMQTNIRLTKIPAV